MSHQTAPFGKSMAIRHWLGMREWLSGERYRTGFAMAKKLVGRAFVRHSKTGLVGLVDPAHVLAVAATLEAVLVMAEGLDGSESLTVSVTNEELQAFVNYMRVLDKEYRYLAERNEELEKYESKAVEASAAASQNDFRPFARAAARGTATGQGSQPDATGLAGADGQVFSPACSGAAADSPLFGGKRPEVFQGHVPMAQNTGQERRAWRLGDWYTP